MKRFFTSISVQLWYPSILLIALVFSTLFFYLPKRQESFIIEIQQNTLQQLANTTALSIEFSIGNDDFERLNESVSHLASQSNLAFAAVYLTNEQCK